MTTDLVFWALAIAAVVSGWRVFRTDSMVRASFLLLLSFIAVAAIMLLLSAPYLGTATVFMMAVEMMVMALFMMMFMMNPGRAQSDEHGPPAELRRRRRSGRLHRLERRGAAEPLPSRPLVDGSAVIHDLGIELLGDSMLIFESAGVTLLAAMIGSVILSSRNGRFGRPMRLHARPGWSMGASPRGGAAAGAGHPMPHGMHHQPGGGA